MEMGLIARWKWLWCLTAVVTAIPALAVTQTLAYTAVPNWPVNNGSAAPDYHRSDVTGVGVGTQGRVYACSGTGHPVVVFDAQGNYLFSFGEGLLTEPHTCRVDAAGNVWVTDFALHQVIKFSPDGVPLLTLGVRGRRGRDATHFSGPTDVAFAPNGDVYISDGYGNSRIARFTASGQFIGEWGSWGKGPGQFKIPHSLAIDANGRVYVADRTNKRIQVFTPTGEFITYWKLKDRPNSVFVTPDQRVYVANWKTNSVSIFDLNGQLLGQWGRGGRTPGRLNEPHMLTVDDQGEVFIAEAGAKRIQKWVVPGG
jgi:DNA-binding beta-propeller fold protein YncE